MVEHKILVIEDKDYEISTIERNLKEHNLESGNEVKFQIKCCKTFDEGLNELITANYSFLILDLKLSSADQTGKGNEIYKIIDDNNLHICTRIVSGTINSLLNQKFVSKKENLMYKKIDRNEVDYSAIINEFQNLVSIGLIDVINNKGILNQNLDKVLDNHLTNAYNHWHKNKFSEINSKKLVKFMSSHINAYLDVNETGELELAEPHDYYHFPCINSELQTGDIFKDTRNDKIYILLNPSCDIIKRNGERKAKKAICCKLRYVLDLNLNSGDTKKLLKNNYSLNYHFLPPYQDFKPKIIDFGNIYWFTFEELESETFKKIGTVTLPFLKEIIDRFANYYARKGQPDLDTNKMKVILDKLKDETI